ncbi:MAG: PilZ domain-containing protein [Magnetococcales bacterium]|nr:PilZ domain-containing protein [Magnetococcales bacterium]
MNPPKDRDASSEAPSSSTSSRRQWPRETATIPMTFVLEDGRRRLSGFSQDVSLGGVALKLDSVPDTINADQEGWVELRFDSKVHRFPCRVVRTAKVTIFVAMDENRRAQFASLVSLMQLSSMRDNCHLLERWDATRGKKKRRPRSTFVPEKTGKHS